MFPRANRWRVWGGAACIGLLAAGGIFDAHQYLFSEPRSRVYRIGFGNDIPFQFKTADGTPTGVAVEIVREAARRRGIQLEWIEPADAGIGSILSGEADLWVLLTDLPERHRQVYITEPYLTMERAFLALKGGRVGSQQDLDRARIGYRQSWAATPLPPAAGASYPNADELYLKRAFPRADLVPIAYDNPGQLVVALRDRRVDAALLNKNVVSALLLTGGAQADLNLVSAPDAISPLGLAASFEAQDAARDIREEMRSMAEDGTITRLTERWGFFESASLDIIGNLAAARRSSRLLAAGVLGLMVAVLFIGFLAIRLRRERDATRAAEQERRRLLEERQEANRLEALGRLAGGVAHDFNNLLTIINGYSSLLFKSLASQPDLQNHVAEIQSAGASAASLIEELLAFSQKRMLKPEILDLNQVVLSSSRMLEKLLGAEIALDLDLTPGLGPVLATVGSLQQVLINLAANARDAMPQGGRLRIRTGAAAAPDAAGVLLTVEDTGHGMPAEILDRIFEPFFTTKEIGKGTGLGLATVYGIVKQQGGSITVKSEVGRGTTFRIHLPTARGADLSPESRSEPAASVASVLPAVTILLAEDDPNVRSLAAGILRSSGCTVLEAVDGAEALEISRSFQGRIDLLVSDVMMPRMRGSKLAEHLRASHPGIPVLLLTGYAAEAVDGLAFGQALSLLKPFSPEQLVAAASKALAARA